VRAVLVTLALLVLTPRRATATAEVDEVERQFFAATRMYRAGHFAVAARAFERIVLGVPDHPRASTALLLLLATIDQAPDSPEWEAMLLRVLTDPRLGVDDDVAYFAHRRYLGFVIAHARAAADAHDYDTCATLLESYARRFTFDAGGALGHAAACRIASDDVAGAVRDLDLIRFRDPTRRPRSASSG
jgi:hypothetical protein